MPKKELERFYRRGRVYRSKLSKCADCIVILEERTSNWDSSLTSAENCVVLLPGGRVISGLFDVNLRDEVVE